MRSLHKACFALALLGAGCTPATGENYSNADGGVEELPFEFKTPGLDQVAPNSLALGDTVQVFGENFLPSEYDNSRLHLVGSYVDEDGTKHDYEGFFPLTVKNQSVASFRFDELVFLAGRDKIGTFTGEAFVESELDPEFRLAGEEPSRSSSNAPLSLDVLPSLSVVEMRSVTEPGCSTITKSTVGDQELAMAVEVIGMGEASTADPMKFEVQFLAPQMRVTYLKDAGVNWGVWPPTDIASIDPAFKAEATQGDNRFRKSIESGSRLTLAPSRRKDVVTVNPGVTMGQDLHQEVILGSFSTGPTDGESRVVSIRVEAEINGQTISRIVNYEVKEAFEIESYDQNVRLMERSDAVPVSGCFSGGDIGADLTYTEGSSITQTRGLSFRWDRNIANTLGITGGVGGLLPYQLMANASTTFSETFGVDVNESISSEIHKGINFTKRIIPGYSGLCYRQVDRLQREVDVIYNNACGANGVIGQTLLSDWNYGFDIATGPECNSITSDLDDGANFEPDGIEYE